MLLFFEALPNSVIPSYDFIYVTYVTDDIGSSITNLDIQSLGELKAVTDGMLVMYNVTF
jgi:hypothetical protein